MSSCLFWHHYLHVHIDVIVLLMLPCSSCSWWKPPALVHWYFPLYVHGCWRRTLHSVLNVTSPKLYPCFFLSLLMLAFSFVLCWFGVVSMVCGSGCLAQRYRRATSLRLTRLELVKKLCYQVWLTDIRVESRLDMEPSTKGVCCPPCKVLLPYTILTYYTIPYHTIPYHTVPYHTISYHTVPYHTMPEETVEGQDLSYVETVA